MPANTAPIFPLSIKNSWGTVATANTAKDGTGTVVTAFTAGANGSRIDTIKVKAAGTNVATVLRLFINNGASNATAANNTLFAEYTIAATTLSEVVAQVENVFKFDGSEREQLVIPNGYKLNVTIGTTVAAGLHVTVVGGDY